MKRGLDGVSRNLSIRSLGRLFLLLAYMLCLAGRASYWQAWLLFGVHAGTGAVALLTGVVDRGLILERLRPGPGTMSWDRLFWALFVTIFALVSGLSALDAGRFGWSAPLPLPIVVGAWLTYGAAIAWNMWAMSVNPFFSSVVRIQKDRGHHVICDGPYRWVRHPGYAGGIVAFTMLPWCLGSSWALVPTLALVPLLVARTFLEDRTLLRDLDGYVDYARRVRFRLLPGGW